MKSAQEKATYPPPRFEGVLYGFHQEMVMVVTTVGG